jgi:hypothetical protein
MRVKQELPYSGRRTSIEINLDSDADVRRRLYEIF